MSDSDLLTIYKIRIKGSKMYSRGRVESTRQGGHAVNWKQNGKEWATEKALKNHLVKCIAKNVDMTDWEIMEFSQQPSKDMNEWLDDEKITFMILKHS